MMRQAGCAVFALLLLAGSPAAAQVARKLDIGLIAGVQYDSNIARANAAQAAARRLEQEDVRFTTGVDLDVALPAGRQSVFLQGGVGYVSYARNARLNRERIDLRGGLDGGFGRCRSKITGGYARGQSELEDLDFGLVKNVEERRSIAFEGRCGQGFGFEPLVTLEKSSTRNSNSVRKSSDRNSFEASAGIAYSQPSFGDLSLIGSYGRTRYPKRLVLIGLDQLSDGFEVYAGGVRYERQIGGRMRGRVSASYTTLRSDLPAVENFKGLTYGVQLTVQPTYRLQTRLSFDRALQPSNRLDVSYLLTETYSADAEYAIGSRLRLIVGGSIKDRIFEKTGTLAVTGPGNERVTTLLGTLRFEQSPRLSFEFNLVNEERDADRPIFDYASTRVGLTAKAGF